MTLLPRLGAAEIITLWHFRHTMQEKHQSYNCSFFPQTIRDWNNLPDLLISSAKVSDDCMSKYSLVTLPPFTAPGDKHMYFKRQMKSDTLRHQYACALNCGFMTVKTIIFIRETLIHVFLLISAQNIDCSYE